MPGPGAVTLTPAIGLPLAQPGRSRIITPPGGVVVTGAGAFALLQPVAYGVETQPPEPGHHLQAAHTDIVAGGTEFVLVLVVVVIGAARLVVRLIRLPLADR